MRILEVIDAPYQLDEGLGDWIGKKMDDLLGNVNMTRYDSGKLSRDMAMAPANIPDDVAEKLVAEFMAKKEHERVLQAAADAQKTTVEKIKPYITHFVRQFVSRWQRISRADKQRMLKDLAMSVFKLILFILEAMVKSKR